MLFCRLNFILFSFLSIVFIQRVSLITSKLQESLETSFLEGLSLNQSDLVLRCLRTYALIDKVGHAEDLFRHNFVKSRIDKLINENCRSTEDLRIMCDNVIEFAQSDCNMLLNLTTEKSGPGKDEREDFVKGFDFLVNSVWPEVDDAIESKLSFIFSPGNPDLFFEVSHGAVSTPRKSASFSCIMITYE